MGTVLGYVLIIGLGSMKLTQLYKEVASRVGLHQVAWMKSFVNLVVCAVLVLLIPHYSATTRTFVALGAAGMAALAHAVDTVLRSHRDDMVSAVMTRSQSRRSR
jgi:hypothetical protein